MKHLLNDEQKQAFIRRLGVVYRNFKKINSGNWTHESAYQEGIVDFCDSLIFVSSEITYDISAIREEVESLFDEIDNENDTESKDKSCTCNFYQLENYGCGCGANDEN